MTKERKNLTPRQKKAWLLKNCVDEYGDLDLSCLDFMDFEGDILITDWKVRKTIWFSNHYVEGSIQQSDHECEGNIEQGNHKVKGNLQQGNNKVKGVIFQSNNFSAKDVYQQNHSVLGKVIN